MTRAQHRAGRVQPRGTHGSYWFVAVQGLGCRQWIYGAYESRAAMNAEAAKARGFGNRPLYAIRVTPKGARA